MEVNDSRLNMFRCCIALIWIDGKVAPEEKEWAETIISRNNFSDRQRRQLQYDLCTRVKFEDVYPGVTDHKNKVYLSYLLNIIANKDGVYTEEELDLLAKVKEDLVKGIDFSKIDDKTSEDIKNSLSDSLEFEDKRTWFEKILNF